MNGQSSRITLTLVKKSHVNEVLSCWTDDLEFLREGLDSRLSDDNPLRRYIADNIDPTPIRSVLASAVTHYGASVIIEKPYLDVESWDSYSSFYSATFTKFDRDSVRLHFFECPNDLAEKAIEELANGSTESELSIGPEKYMGYCVLRPLLFYNVGRSAVVFDNRPPAKTSESVVLLELEQQGQPHLTVAHKCQVRIMNALFSFVAPEFIQQDPNLGHCATASLWVANKIISSTLGANSHRYGAITRRAHNESGAPLSFSGLSPSPDERPGLSSSEIKNAFISAGVGYQNSYLDMRDNRLSSFASNAQLIYSYVESGLPVLFCLKGGKGTMPGVSGHVVTSVGHSLPRLKSTPPKEFSDLVERLCHESRHVPIGALSLLYYVHDDCYGPYNRLQLCYPEETDSSEKGSEDKKFKVKLGRKQVDYNLQEIIVPVHPRHRSNALFSLWDAQKTLDAEIREFEEEIGEKLFPTGTVFVWRSFLAESSKFKASICERGYSNFLRSRIGSLHLSKYIWVHEYTVTHKDSIFEVFPEDAERMIHGEFIYDATSPKNYTHLLVKRSFLGYLWDYSMEPTEPYLFDEDANFYRCYVSKKK